MQNQLNNTKEFGVAELFFHKIKEEIVEKRLSFSLKKCIITYMCKGGEIHGKN